MPSNKNKKLLKILLPIPVLLAGLALVGTLAATRPEAGRSEATVEGLLVETVIAEVSDVPLRIPGQGTVMPARQVPIQSQVAGRVVWQSASLVPGARVSANTPLVRVDTSDYRLALTARTAEVDRARLNLEVEQGRRAVAEREWGEFGGGPSDTDSESQLARRGPHVHLAQQSLRAAQSAAQRARLELGRTTVRAPFNAVVVSEQVDVGQLVGPQAPLGSLVGTDRFWVQVSIPVDDLGVLELPGADGEGGSTAEVTQRSNEGVSRYRGTVVRLMPDLDPLGRMARLLIAIEDPLQLELPEEERDPIPLLLGSYVDVTIAGRSLASVIRVPSRALRNGNEVLIANSDNRMELRSVEIAWRLDDSVLVSSGLEAGAAIITSRVSAPVEGMPLRLSTGVVTPSPETNDGPEESP